ncbi:acetyl-CoA carboxylase biotin carboxylase subunit family protein [Streptomyces sp. NPDC057654]|uniref:ATP-grasp domain-containing protein n=1 Tax=Streptomyces sp. NPDC057654 TaxID=3346196 RepID=UPI0036C82BA2
MTVPHRHPMLLIIGSGPPATRRYLLELTAAHSPLLLIDDVPPTWQRPYIADHRIADLTDPLAVTAAADALAARWPLAGVLTWDENHVMATARIAARRALPGNSPAAVAAARDKAVGRQRFAAANLPSAEFTWVHTQDAAAAAAGRIGYLAVLKPAAHAGSVGVVRVDADLPAAWAIAEAGAVHQGSEGQGVLLEEYLHGPEISVETATYQCQTTAVAITRKTLGFKPYFMETGHCITADDPLLATTGPVVAAAVQSLGITDGVSHVEMRLTETGPRLIEVNARMGGDLSAELVQRATGTNLARAAASIACGRAPDLRPTEHLSAAVGILYPPADGLVVTRRLQPGNDEQLAQSQWLCDLGDHVTLTPSSRRPNNIRTALAVVTGADADSARQDLDDVLARAVLEVHTPHTHAA